MNSAFFCAGADIRILLWSLNGGSLPTQPRSYSASGAVQR